MKKVGIITLYGDKNYGNKFQNYAVYSLIRKMGYNPINCIDNTDIGISKSVRIKIDIAMIASGNIKEFKRKLLFRKFHYSYIKNNLIVNPRDHIDVYKLLCGSDQIWNPYFAAKETYFGSFVDDEKRVAISASFGVESIPEEKLMYFKKNINNFDKISVREESAADLVESMVGVRPKVLIDPTMMIDKKEWMLMSKKPKFHIKKKYILTYFLGNISEEIRRFIDEIAKINDFEIINLENNSKNVFWYKTGPSEFLWLLNNSELICTDSFHGTAFSINFHKPFVIFDRMDEKVSMHSRLKTLLEKFDLEERMNCFDIKNVMSIDYSNTDYLLKKEREKFETFLKGAIN